MRGAQRLAINVRQSCNLEQNSKQEQQGMDRRGGATVVKVATIPESVSQSNVEVDNLSLSLEDGRDCHDMRAPHIRNMFDDQR